MNEKTENAIFWTGIALGVGAALLICIFAPMKNPISDCGTNTLLNDTLRIAFATIIRVFAMLAGFVVGAVCGAIVVSIVKGILNTTNRIVKRIKEPRDRHTANVIKPKMTYSRFMNGFLDFFKNFFHVWGVFVLVDGILYYGLMSHLHGKICFVGKTGPGDFYTFTVLFSLILSIIQAGTFTYYYNKNLDAIKTFFKVTHE